MELARKIFDGGNDARRRAIDGVADYRVMLVAHGFQNAPARQIPEGVKIAGRSTKEDIQSTFNSGVTALNLITCYFACSP